MYKFLLSWRYLRTRYIALASIISVTLGVATLVIVNSVMAGFTEEMEKRLNGILSDLVVECHDLIGLRDPNFHQEEIRSILGDDIEGMTTTVHVPGMLMFKYRNKYQTRQVNIIGIDAATYARVSDFGQYLLHPENRKQLSFLLREDGYAPDRKDLPPSGWQHRRLRAEFEKQQLAYRRAMEQQREQPQPEPAPPGIPQDPLAAAGGETTNYFDAGKQQHTGIIVGIALCSIRDRHPETGEVMDFYLCRPGDDAQLAFPNCGSPPKVIRDSFTIVDFYESKMSEYDSSFVFVPLDKLQDLRGMMDPQSLEGGTVTAIQIKLKKGVDLQEARDRLRARFPVEEYPYDIRTWRDMQGPLLAAVQLETTILNILLFLIIAVAGFGILATFFMIVVEKTRDIGILKALGAPSGGVMSIFLSYGLSLGMVGSGAGAILGLLFVRYINQIADLMERATGREVFDPTIYYFQDIPARVEPWTVVWVAIGAVMIAVMASVLPALRAARLHPVEALRYE